MQYSKSASPLSSDKFHLFLRAASRKEKLNEKNPEFLLKKPESIQFLKVKNRRLNPLKMIPTYIIKKNYEFAKSEQKAVFIDFVKILPHNFSSHLTQIPALFLLNVPSVTFSLIYLFKECI